MFDAAVSRWANAFSNEVALFRTSDGGMLRISEMRRIGLPNVEPSVRFSILGTKGSFEQQTGASVWATRDSFQDVSPLLETATRAGSDDGRMPKQARFDGNQVLIGRPVHSHGRRKDLFANAFSSFRTRHRPGPHPQV